MNEKYFNLSMLVGTLLLIVFTFGCVSNSISNTSNEVPISHPSNISNSISNTSNEVPISHPSNIRQFSIVKEGQILRGYFILEDANGSIVTGSGDATLIIRDESNQTVYSSTFHFTPKDFVEYEYTITGKRIGKAFEFRINISSIKKGIGEGTAYLKIKLNDGTTLSASENYIYIPTYTKDELWDLFTDKFNENAKFVNESLKKGPFEVQLIKYGVVRDFFNMPPTFLALLNITNEGTVKDHFYMYDNALIVENKQFEPTSGSTIIYEDIYPGVTKTVLLIYTINNDTHGDGKLVVGFWLSPDAEEVPFEFDVKV